MTALSCVVLMTFFPPDYVICSTGVIPGMMSLVIAMVCLTLWIVALACI